MESGEPKVDGALEASGPSPLDAPLAEATSAAAKSNTDCIFFLASPLMCKKGDQCEFRHSQAARLNPRECFFWMNQRCLKPNCPFRHPPLAAISREHKVGQIALPGTPDQQQQAASTNQQTHGTIDVPCIFFQRGYCAKGSYCPFLHDTAPSAAEAGYDPAPTSEAVSAQQGAETVLRSPSPGSKNGPKQFAEQVGGRAAAANIALPGISQAGNVPTVAGSNHVPALGLVAPSGLRKVGGNASRDAGPSTAPEQTEYRSQRMNLSKSSRVHGERSLVQGSAHLAGISSSNGVRTLLVSATDEPHQLMSPVGARAPTGLVIRTMGLGDKRVVQESGSTRGEGVAAVLLKNSQAIVEGASNGSMQVGQLTQQKLSGWRANRQQEGAATWEHTHGKNAAADDTAPISPGQARARSVQSVGLLPTGNIDKKSGLFQRRISAPNMAHSAGGGQDREDPAFQPPKSLADIRAEKVKGRIEQKRKEQDALRRHQAEEMGRVEGSRQHQKNSTLTNTRLHSKGVAELVGSKSDKAKFSLAASGVRRSPEETVPKKTGGACVARPECKSQQESGLNGTSRITRNSSSDEVGQQKSIGSANAGSSVEKHPQTSDTESLLNSNEDARFRKPRALSEILAEKKRKNQTEGGNGGATLKQQRAGRRLRREDVNTGGDEGEQKGPEDRVQEIGSEQNIEGVEWKKQGVDEGERLNEKLESGYNLQETQAIEQKEPPISATHLDAVHRQTKGIHDGVLFTEDVRGSENLQADTPTEEDAEMALTEGAGEPDDVEDEVDDEDLEDQLEGLF